MGEKPTENMMTLELKQAFPAPLPAPSPVERTLNAWFVDWFCGVPGMTADFFNRCTAAKEDLKARLAAQPKET